MKLTRGQAKPDLVLELVQAARRMGTGGLLGCWKENDNKKLFQESGWVRLSAAPLMGKG